MTKSLLTRKMSTMPRTCPGSCGAQSFGHAGGRFPPRRGATEDSSELSSFHGSLVSGDVCCLVV